MADPKPQMVGVVIRADGTVPFDDDCHPHVRGAILAHLTDSGHSYDPVKGSKHVKIRGWKRPGKGNPRPDSA